MILAARIQPHHLLIRFSVPQLNWEVDAYPEMFIQMQNMNQTDLLVRVLVTRTEFRLFEYKQIELHVRELSSGQVVSSGGSSATITIVMEPPT